MRWVLILSLLLAGCAQWLPEDQLHRLSKKERAAAHKIKAYMVKDNSHPPVEKEIGVIEGISCQLLSGEHEATPEEAIEKLCLKAIALGGDGVIGIHRIEQPAGESIGNCRSIAMRRGIAVKFSSAP